VADWLANGDAASSSESPRVVAPLALDIVAGKNDPIYNDHPYHTKVPHRAIMRHILHHTRPGDVVLDGFCGSGMTGVAAQLCGDVETLRDLGLTLDDHGQLRDAAGSFAGVPGPRRALLADLSPLAGLLSYHHNRPLEPAALREAIAEVLGDVEANWGWLQATLHEPTPDQLAQALAWLEARTGDSQPQGERPAALPEGLPWADQQFTVWSDEFECPKCGQAMVFFEVAVDPRTGRVRDSVTCPHCRKRTLKRQLRRVFETVVDPQLDAPRSRARQVPVRINYEWRGKRYEKAPDAFDNALHQWLERTRAPFEVPTPRMPLGRESRRNDAVGITHVHHFYPPANLWLLGALSERIGSLPDRLRQAALLIHSAANIYASRLRRFRAGKKGGGPLSGTLYVSSLNTPANALKTFERNGRVFVEAAAILRRMPGEVRVSVQSSTLPLAPPGSVDYVFVDPPFGGNIMYAELNFLWEAWLGVVTDAADEAVENPATGKRLADYERLLGECFRRFHEALKPGGWMTVVFHHADPRVWNAARAALHAARFAIRDVRTLDKCQDSFKQINHEGSVKYDLLISAERLADSGDHASGNHPEMKAASEDRVGVADAEASTDWLGQFIDAELAKAAPARDRAECLLYSRLVAECLCRGRDVPVTAAAFYATLRERRET
jgi:DNA modification methylase